MDSPTFWRLIEDAREGSDSCEALAERLVDRLWDLWGAAYIINGGCSDDGFEHFRGWLIGQGQQTYEGALRDPESLVDVVTGRDELPPRYAPHPEEPSGARWTEEELDTRFPKLTAAFG